MDIWMDVLESIYRANLNRFFESTKRTLSWLYLIRRLYLTLLIIHFCLHAYVKCIEYMIKTFLGLALIYLIDYKESILNELYPIRASAHFW